MRKSPMIGGIALLFCVLMAAPAAQAGDGGIAPCLASCCLGPRIGLEMNEDIPVEMVEALAPFIGIVQLWVIYDYGYRNAGVSGALASCCLGPRIGKQLNERKIRTMEWLRLVPVINLYAWASVGMEAYGGKTMTDVEAAENLTK